MSKAIDGLKAVRDEGVTLIQAVYAIDGAILRLEKLEGLLRVCLPLIILPIMNPHGGPLHADIVEALDEGD